ncbi:MAG TPA: HNH endonuclease [Tepidisphaeraceae bacterium]|jgi:hypothetical protein|nr:HNH endonuclease [Tepidisphaeraceae bacterium]
MSQELFCPDSFSVEHIIPRARQGAHEPENLAFCCQGCNGFKYDFIDGRDPSSGQIVALFNPRTQRWIDHFSWTEDFTEIVGLTPASRATIIRLQLNRPGLQNLRAALVTIRRHPPPHSLR